MVTKDDVEGFLNRLNADGASYSEVEPNLWIIRPSGELDFGVVVHYSPPVVVLTWVSCTRRYRKPAA